MNDVEVLQIVKSLLEIKDSAQIFLNKVDEVTVHPTYQKIFNDARIHGNGYSGPTFVAEMDKIRQILEKFDELSLSK